MEELKQLHDLYILKEIERRTTVAQRRESSAEHTYSCIILADYFLDRLQLTLDKVKIMRMLLYHDMIEIYAGDTFILDEKALAKKKEQEHQAFQRLKQKIPKSIADTVNKLWIEFEENATPEAQFCQAIDKLDPIIHTLYKKQDWKKNGFTEKKLRKKKEKYFTPFPEILKLFNNIINYLNQNDYFAKE